MGYNDSTKNDKKTGMVIVLVLIVATGAIALITQTLIKDLDTNSKKMRSFEVKESLEGRPAFELAGKYTTKSNKHVDDDSHPAATELYKRGVALEGVSKWGEAHSCYAQAITSYKNDWEHDIRDPQDVLRVRALFARIARCLTMEHHYKAALDHINASIGGKSDEPRYLRQRADIYDLMKQPQLARADRVKADEAQLNPRRSAETDITEQLLGGDH